VAPEKTPKTARVLVQLSAPLHHQLARAAKSCGVTRAAFIRVALERELALEEELAPLYQADEELTACTALDSEDFS
jgi:hypothetical protein